MATTVQIKSMRSERTGVRMEKCNEGVHSLEFASARPLIFPGERGHSPQGVQHPLEKGRQLPHQNTETANGASLADIEYSASPFLKWTDASLRTRLAS
jgi:hypothetical protein